MDSWGPAAVLSRLAPILRRLSAPESFADALRVLLAMLGVAAFGLLGGYVHAMVAMLLGVVAAALAETEDGWRRRLRALAGTLACFLVASLLVEVLFDLPWVFAVVLALGSFALVMLGAASPRYTTIAFATLLLAVYTMIGLDQPDAAHLPMWQAPLLLVAGAAWYGMLATAWSALFVHRAVRQALARLYDALGTYIEIKSRLFEPVREVPIQALQADLAQANAAVVDALNACRTRLVDRLELRRRHAPMERLLRMYLVAQDIHERAVSSHYPYQELAKAFFHSDVMFRGQRLMRGLAGSCHARATALRLGGDFTPSAQVDEALEDLRHALARQGESLPAPPPELLHAVTRLADNLERLLIGIRCADAETASDSDRSLHDPSPVSLVDAWRRVQLQLTPASARFRHGLRLGLGMLIGYIVLLQVHPAEGYWVLLTIMLVCRPSHDATRMRVLQRVGGTVAGLLLGWALLRLFPSTHVQVELAVAAGVMFFVTRYRRYLVATAAITVFVLLAFNQIGNSYALIAPRLLDTLLGSLIAVAVTFLVLPDWRERELRLLFAGLLETHARYLRAIIAQYVSGKRDDLTYRLARRDAHDADAELSGHLAHSLQDPGRQRSDPELVLRMLGASQELLSHLSALGAHRQQLPVDRRSARSLRQAESLADDLESLSATLQTAGLLRSEAEPQVVPEPVREGEEDENPARHLVTTQVRLLRAQFPVLKGLCLQLRALDIS